MSKETPPTFIPSVFCWTKIGPETGSSLPAILRRKELERRAGAGTFCWGVGNALEEFERARDAAPGGELEIVFTLMRNQAQKKFERSPPELLLWLSYWGERGIEDLPAHMIVSSRARYPSGRRRKRHYALLCESGQDLTQEPGDLELDANHVREFAQPTRVADSRVAAMAEYTNERLAGAEKLYQVAFRARFHGAGFVELANPVEIQGGIAELYKQLEAAKNADDWEKCASRLKAEARPMVNHAWDIQDRLDDLLRALENEALLAKYRKKRG